MQLEVGDLVRIRSWEDMADEYGEFQSGIPMSLWDFTSDMRFLCGEEFRITDIKACKELGISYSKLLGLEQESDGWRTITDEMVELVKKNTRFNDVQSDTLDGFLSTYAMK